MVAVAGVPVVFVTGVLVTRVALVSTVPILALGGVVTVSVPVMSAAPGVFGRAGVSCVSVALPRGRIRHRVLLSLPARGFAKLPRGT